MPAKKKKALFAVTSKTKYIAEQSDVPNQKFVWSYEIKIENHSKQIVQLLNRFWRFVDMMGHIEEIHGVGVVGLQPLIKPGQEFSYTSFCQLFAPQGTMEGYYEMQNLKDEKFKVEVPKFILSAPTPITRKYSSRLH